MSSSNSKEMFVIAAQVAAHLHSATNIAKQLSLTAKNARAITARAGQQAAGFTAITGFIQELATTTITLSQQIDSIAVNIAMRATDLKRTAQAHDALRKVLTTAQESAHVNSIKPFIKNSEDKATKLNSEFKKMLNTLVYLVEQIRLQIRSAAVISAMSKVEASKSGEFEQQLKVIAQNIFDAADNIRLELVSAESLLSYAQG